MFDLSVRNVFISLEFLVVGASVSEERILFSLNFFSFTLTFGSIWLIFYLEINMFVDLLACLLACLVLIFGSLWLT